MKSAYIHLAIMTALVSAAPALAQTKCISLPQAKSLSNSADPTANFSLALRKTRECADAEAYDLASKLDAPEAIAWAVVDRCKRHVDEQARFAVLADLGWTYQGVEKNELKALNEKALAAVRSIRAGGCPVTMMRAGDTAGAAAAPRPRG